MRHSNVTVIIAGNTYTLRLGDPNSLCNIPAADRDQLIGILEALKTQRDKSERVAQDALSSVMVKRASARSTTVENPVQPVAERLGKGDVDTIMARLIADEKQQRKSGLKPATIYKFAAVIIAIIALLSFL